jgi:hypothetical protein
MQGGKVEVGPGREAAQKSILDKILGGLIADSKPEVRAAACAWLLGLVSFAGRNASVLARLSDIQEAFTSLLGDSNEAAQVSSAPVARIPTATGECLHASAACIRLRCMRCCHQRPAC